MTSELHHNISHQGCSRTSRKTWTLKSVKTDKKRCFNLKALRRIKFQTQESPCYSLFFEVFQASFFCSIPPFWEKQGSGGRWTYINDALKNGRASNKNWTRCCLCVIVEAILDSATALKSRDINEKHQLLFHLTFQEIKLGQSVGPNSPKSKLCAFLSPLSFTLCP